jgi:phosphatidylglycerol:prolipoprotein diacylglycerol transferase
VLPYVEHPTLEVGSYSLTAFRVLVLAAIVTQFQIVTRRAPRFGITRDVAASLIAWAIVLGLIGAHVFDVLAYFPERLRENPLELFRFWGSLSSTGGMAGGLLGLYVVARRRGLSREQMLSFFDCCMFALPFTLALGRLGCGLQHDHPGVSSEHFLAVAFPDGGRFDLGLLEFFMVSGVAALFLLLDRWPRPGGFYAGLFFALYGPGRFALDFLRIDDARYASLTPAQFLMIGASVGGIGVLIWSLRRGQTAS